MIGVIIITHESIGDAYRSLAQHFFPELPPGIRLLGVQRTENHDDIIAKALSMITETDSGHGVLVLTDIFGATPCNAARKLLAPGKVAMLTGLNAPMMIKAVQYASRSDDLLAFTETVKQAAIDGILAITNLSEEGCSSC